MKKVMITLTLAAFTMMAQAQFSVGVRGGFNLTNFAELDYEGEKIDKDYRSKFKPGFQVGIVGNLPIINNLSIQPGLLFATQGARYKEDWEESFMGQTFKIEHTTTMNLNYLQMPINLQLGLDLGDARLLLQAGPYLGFAFSGKYNMEVSINGEKESSDEKIEIGNDKEKHDIKAFDFGVGFGLGVQFGNLQIGLGYNLGLMNLAHQRGDNKNSMRNNGLVLTATYLFGGGNNNNHRR